MAIFRIGGKAYYLNFDLQTEVRSQALSHKDALWQIGSMIAGNPDAKEAKKLVYDHIAHIHKAEINRFHEEFASFDLVDNSAQINTWEILNDCCLFYECGWLEDMRDNPLTGVFADMLYGDAIQYPLGRYFRVVFAAPPSRIGRILSLKRAAACELVIECAQVRRIVGTFQQFVIEMATIDIHCKHGAVTISPHGWPHVSRQ